jgi:hypothetical protein
MFQHGIGILGNNRIRQISSAVNVEEGTNSRQTVHRLQPPVTSDPDIVANRGED